MTVVNLEEYFTYIKAYHETEPGQRARLFHGRIEIAAQHATNPVTRKLLDNFIKKEKPKYDKPKSASRSH